jgi:hypothetical protein
VTREIYVTTVAGSHVYARGLFGDNAQIGDHAATRFDQHVSQFDVQRRQPTLFVGPLPLHLALQAGIVETEVEHCCGHRLLRHGAGCRAAQARREERWPIRHDRRSFHWHVLAAVMLLRPDMIRILSAWNVQARREATA